MPQSKFRICQTAFLFAAVVFGLMLSSSANAQGRLPRADYYNNYGINAPYFQADYLDAGKSFQRGYNRAYKFGNRRHLDSICHLTMMGECYYHVGNYADAVNQYEQALALYLSYQAENWQRRVRIPQQIQANSGAFQQSKVNWGVPRRNSVPARLPNSFGMLFGQLDSERTLQEGGVVQNAEIYKVDVVEIMRCTALCMHRRRVIKGAIAKYDPFTDQLVSGLSVSGAGNGSVMGAFNGVLLGIAYASMEEWEKAARMLTSSLQLKGMDHALKPVAMVELAQLALKTERYAEAGTLAMEASLAAGVYSQYDLVEEALGIGTTVHLMRAKSAYPPLENAILWAKANKARMLQASLIVKLAECLAEAGDSKGASFVLRQASGPINNRNSLPNAVVSARLKYVGAITQFLDGNFRGGMSSLSASLQHFQKGSKWLYQLRLADQLVAKGSITERQADLLYSALLRDPTDQDWKRDPMEAIAFLASPHVGSMEVWLDVTVNRLNHKQALEVSELVRRHRFFSYLPFGGRLMAFRWMIHAPEEALSANALAQRTNFLNTNPVYKKLYDRANQIQRELATLPLKPASKTPEEHQQGELLKELASISDTQEAILASLALRREPAEMVFPPQIKTSELQESLSPEQLALVSIATSKGYHIYLLTNQSIQYVGLSDGRQVLRGVGGLLKDAGLMDSALDIKTLEETKWKETARELKLKLFGDGSDEVWPKFKELVVVPDGVLWYLPFEILPIGEGDEEKYLSDIVNIRYSPTLFLAFGPQRPALPIERSAFVTTRFHQRGAAGLATDEFATLLKTMPDAIQYDKQIRVPSNYLIAMMDQLVIWSEIKSSKNLPLAMTPIQLDQSKIGKTLDNWMALPWKGPEHIVMPGFHSDGGSGMRGKLNGKDLFLTSMAFMASGSRTALISRWATGGKTSLSLTAQYASNLGKDGSAKAILDARQATRELDLDYENEPRVRSKKSDAVLKAEHPFFWASHMLLGIPDNRPTETDDPDSDEVVDGMAGDADVAKDAADADADKGAMKDVKVDDAKDAEVKPEDAGAAIDDEGNVAKKAEEANTVEKPAVVKPLPKSETKKEEKPKKKPVVRFGTKPKKDK